MNIESGRLFGSPESSTGQVREEAFLDEITSFIDNKDARQLSKKLVALALSQFTAEKDFCRTSNEVGIQLEAAGRLELAAGCFDWSFQQFDSVRNFKQPNLVVYAGNLVRVLQKISQQPNLSEQGKTFLKNHKRVVEDIGIYFGDRKDFAIGLRAIAQLDQQGGIAWGGDEDENKKFILGLQDQEKTAITLANLL